jgi:hypothetical protein
MEISQRRGIPSYLYTLTNKLKYDNYPIILAGTAGLASQQFYSDFDLLSIIDKKYTSEDAFNKIMDILKFSENFNDLYFIELKLQTKKGDKLKYNSIDEINKKEFEKFYKDIDFIKMDFVIRLDNKFIELSIIYSFSGKKLSSDDIIKSLVDDISELKKEGNYFKALKRIFGIYNNKYVAEKLVDTSKYKFLSQFFNSEWGKLYQTTSNLKAIKLLLEHYDDEETIKRALLNLKDLKIEPNLNKIDGLIKSNENKYNAKAKKILGQLKNIK